MLIGTAPLLRKASALYMASCSSFDRQPQPQPHHASWLCDTFRYVYMCDRFTANMMSIHFVLGESSANQPCRLSSATGPTPQTRAGPKREAAVIRRTKLKRSLLGMMSQTTRICRKLASRAWKHCNNMYRYLAFINDETSVASGWTSVAHVPISDLPPVTIWCMSMDSAILGTTIARHITVTAAGVCCSYVPVQFAPTP
jgi:hypothetical protein